MVDRGHNWTVEEIRALLVIWLDATIQRQLLGLPGTLPCSGTFRRSCGSEGIRQEAMSGENKSFETKFKEVADHLRRSSVGIESDDEPDNHEVYLGFKWFADLHAVMRTRAVVSPPVLLDTSTLNASAVSNPDVNDQQLETEPSESEQVQTDSDRPETARSSATAPGPTPSYCSATAFGPSTSDNSATASGDTTQGPAIKKGRRQRWKKGHQKLIFMIHQSLHYY